MADITRSDSAILVGAAKQRKGEGARIAQDMQVILFRLFQIGQKGYRGFSACLASHYLHLMGKEDCFLCTFLPMGLVLFYRCFALKKLQGRT